MATRTIQATISSNTNTDLEPGGSARFTVTSDTGPVSGMTATGGSLYLSRIKVYSSAFYLTVSPNSGGTAKTEALSANSGETGSTTLDLDSVNDSLLSGSPSSITLTVTKISGDKTKMNFRDGCTLTLKIDYQEGGSSGGDSGGSSGGGISAPYLDKVTGVRLSAEESRGEPVTLSWDAASNKTNNTVTHYQIARALADEENYLDYGIFVENTGNVTSYEVYPPDEIGNRWYSFYVRAIGTAGEAMAGEWSDECGWLERLPSTTDIDPYTDPTLTANETYVKAVHMTELQSNINKIRDTFSLAAYKFTSITSGTTGLAGWTDHVNELRAAIDEIGKTHETWISITVNQPRADVITQLREVVAEIAAG